MEGARSVEGSKEWEGGADGAEVRVSRCTAISKNGTSSHRAQQIVSYYLEEHQ